jgi:hypothetical protein
MKHRHHKLLDRILFGREYGEVHRFMDWPARIFKSEHRKYRHDLETALLMLLKHKDVNAMNSALMHIALDRGEEVRRKMAWGKREKKKTLRR